MCKYKFATCIIISQEPVLDLQTTLGNRESFMEDIFKGTPKYQLIENDIIDKINRGVYVADEQLPSEAQLAQEYHCSRVTVRQALSDLAYKGHIYKRKGSGSFVNQSNLIERSPFIKSFTTEMAELGKKVTSNVKTFTITVAGKTLASILKIKPTDQIYYIERVRYADDQPIMFEKTFMSVALHPDMSIKVLQTSKYRYADEHGLSPEIANQVISPIFPPDYIAQELNINPKAPIIRISNVTTMKNGNVFDYTELYLNSDLYQLNIIKRR